MTDFGVSIVWNKIWETDYIFPIFIEITFYNIKYAV